MLKEAGLKLQGRAKLSVNNDLNFNLLLSQSYRIYIFRTGGYKLGSTGNFRGEKNVEKKDFSF